MKQEIKIQVMIFQLL